MAGGRGPLWLWLLGAAIALTALIVYLIAAFPETLVAEENRMRLAASLLWVALIGASVVLHWRARPGHALRNMAIWAAIALGLLVLYSYRNELGRLKDRVSADLLPHRGTTRGANVTFRVQEGGQFVVEAEVDGTPVRFLVDTGASDVILSPLDARRIGFDPPALDYTRRYNTANGVVLGAPVRLKRITVGPITVTDVRASVNRVAMTRSLLGMSFLERLSAYGVSDGTLTLSQ